MNSQPRLVVNHESLSINSFKNMVHGCMCKGDHLNAGNASPQNAKVGAQFTLKEYQNETRTPAVLMKRFIGGLGPFQRTLLLVWAMAFISWVGYAVFSDLGAITGSVVGALGLIVGILATVFGFLKNKANGDVPED